MRRRRRPGVTAAATTAVFATGARPGVTARAKTAVFAIGARMTPTVPTRSGPARVISREPEGARTEICHRRTSNLGPRFVARSAPHGTTLGSHAHGHGG